MHWITRENITEQLRSEITESQRKLSALLERTISNRPEDPIEIYRTRSMLEARLNNAKSDLENWLDVPRIF
jgi:hypothetical protein